MHISTALCIITCLIASVSCDETGGDNKEDYSDEDTGVGGPDDNIKQKCEATSQSFQDKDQKCDECVKNGQCFFCLTTFKCKPYPVGHILPTPADCAPDMGAARWGTCSVNFKAVIIAIGVLSGIILIIIPCCLYCMCCGGRRVSDGGQLGKGPVKGKGKGKGKEGSRKPGDRSGQRRRQGEKQAERQKKYDEIRRKYGLMLTERGSREDYVRFEHEA